MDSEMQSAATVMGGESSIEKLRKKLAARLEWAIANPEISALWDDAMHEDHQWELRRERESLEQADRVRATDVLRTMSVPLDAVDALERLTDSEHVTAARKFWASQAAEKRFLLLLGTIGTGKTVAAAFVLHEAITRARGRVLPTGGEARRSTPTMFVRAATFSRLSAYDAKDRAWFEEMCACGVLVLDDLAAESLSPVGAAMLDELLDHRYGARLRTVITSNLDKEAFLLRIGARAADRMRHFAVLSQSSGRSLRTKAVRP